MTRRSLSSRSASTTAGPIKLLASIILSAVLLAGCAPVAPEFESAPSTDASSAPIAPADAEVTPDPTQAEQPALEPTEPPSDAPEVKADAAPVISKPKPVDEPKKKPEQPSGQLLAAAVLEELPVKGRAPKTGYARDHFGKGWGDPDRNGCDTRNDILTRDLTKLSYRDGTHGCVVLSGVLDDPFSGKKIDFLRGQKTSSAVQIDHVVSLSNAWQTGAQKWSGEERAGFSNDPLNLLAVDGPLNGQKGDGDAATWLPPNKKFRCPYVARQIAVKAKWGAWVTTAERDAMRRVLQTCPDQQLPDGSESAKVLGVASTPKAAAKPDKTPAPKKPTPAKPTEPAKPAKPAKQAEPAPKPTYFKNCTAARDAGAAPVYAGDPGYAKHLDRDGDGVGCE